MLLRMSGPTAAKSRYLWMIYKLTFREEAKKEWDGLSQAVRAQLKKKLAERLENPHVPASRLHCSVNRYKIKLRSAGFRLVYEVRDCELIVSVVAIGKRERNAVYRDAARRS